MRKRLLTSFALLFTMLATFTSCSNSNNTTNGSNDLLTSSAGNCSAPSDVVGKYTISFYSDGGSDVSSIIAPPNTSITKPSDPVKPGYTFDDWYTDYGAYKNAFIFDKMPNQNVVLYAKWTQMSEDQLKEYENSINAYSQENHLYIHYKRFTDDQNAYKDWDVWVWPKNETGRIFDWSTTITYDSLGGVVADIDLTQTYTDAGNNKDQTISFMENGTLKDELGFLIVLKSSRNVAGSHWQSDGGSDTYFKISDGIRENKSIHLFIIQDNVKDFTYSYSNRVVDNPYDNDDGTFTSDNLTPEQGLIDSSSNNKAQYPVQPTSPDFYNNAGVGYQIMLASFADSDGDGLGDIYGITKNLDYLKNTLNVDVLWLTPVQLSDSYHGYDISDYDKVDPKFGSLASPNVKDGVVTEETAMKDYEDLLNAAHDKDMRVIMDLVINHTSANNIWFRKSCQLDPTYRYFYQWKNHEKSNLSDEWHRYSTYDYSYYGKFASSMPELNYDYQGTRDAIVGMANRWLDKGVDGFRIDAVKHIYMADEVDSKAGDVVIKDYDSSTQTDYSSNLTKNLNFFREFNARIKAEHPNAFIVGENFDGHTYRVAPYYEGFDSMLDFYGYFANIGIFAAGDGKCVASRKAGASPISASGEFTPDRDTNVAYGGAWNLPSSWNAMNLYRGEGNNNKEGYKAIDSFFTSNHDIDRLINGVNGTGNGDDTVARDLNSNNASNAIKKAKVASAIALTMPGITWIYYGDELGMSGNNQDGSSSHADRWYRQPFKWSKEANNYTTGYTFSGDKTYAVGWDNYNKTLDGVQEQLLNENSLLSEYAKLTALKNDHSTLINGSYTPITSTANSDLFAFERTKGTEKYVIYHNCSSTQKSISLSGTVIYSLNGASLNTLPGFSSIVVKVS